MEVEQRPVSRQEMEARDLMAGDARQGVDRGREDFVDVERAADGVGDLVKDLEVALHGRGQGQRSSQTSCIRLQL
jgi:hypothetical protein